MTDSSIHGPPVRLVISGGIGSGKSTVAARLRELGAAVIEADVIGHEVLEVGGAAHDAVAQRWPTVVTDGLIDRSALAEIVFADMAQLRARWRRSPTPPSPRRSHGWYQPLGLPLLRWSCL